MMDIIMIGIAVGFFALTWGLVVLSDNLMGKDGPAQAQTESPKPKTAAPQVLAMAPAKGR